MADSSSEVAVTTGYQNLRDLVNAKRLADGITASPIQDSWQRITLQPLDIDLSISMDTGINRNLVISMLDVQTLESGAPGNLESLNRYWVKGSASGTLLIGMYEA